MARFSTQFGAYEIDSTPGQPQVAHCHSLFVFSGVRGSGYGHKLKNHQNAKRAELGYDFATCTVATANMPQLRVLQSAGWVQLSQFKNSRTGEKTEVWGYSVQKESHD